MTVDEAGEYRADAKTRKEQKVPALPKVHAITLRRITAELGTDERPEVKIGARTTLVVMAVVLEEEWPSGKLRTTRVNGYRKERPRVHHDGDFRITHEHVYYGGRAPAGLHELIRQMRQA